MARDLQGDGGTGEVLNPPEHALPLLQTARERFEAVKADAARPVEAATDRCVRWEVASDEYFSFDPLDVELRAHTGAGRGRLLKAEPKRGGFHRFGFDSGDALLVAEAVNGFRHIECVGDGGRDTLVVEVSPRGKHRLRSASARLEAAGGTRLVAGWGGKDAWTVREYRRGSSGRIVEIIETTPQWVSTASVEYDAMGQPSAILEGPARAVRWQRPPPNLRSLLAWYESALIAALGGPIEFAVRELHAVALALVFSGSGGDPLPPELSVTTRERIRNSPVEMRFDPHNMVGDRADDDFPELRLEDSALLEVGQAIARASEGSEVEKLLRKVAKAATKQSWPVGDGGAARLAVYATDLDRGEWDADLRACVSKSQRMKLGLEPRPR